RSAAWAPSHPLAVALDAAVKLTAVLVLLVEDPEHFEQTADMCRGQKLDVVTVLCVTHVYYSFIVAFVSASRAACWTARRGIRSHPVPVALVGECSIPVVYKVARQLFSS